MAWWFKLERAPEELLKPLSKIVFSGGASIFKAPPRAKFSIFRR